MNVLFIGTFLFRLLFRISCFGFRIFDRKMGFSVKHYIVIFGQLHPSLKFFKVMPIQCVDSFFIFSTSLGIDVNSISPFLLIYV